LIDSYLRDRENPVNDAAGASRAKRSFNRSVVIDLLVDPTSAKDHSILNASQLAEEVIMLLSAGNDTTSNAMIIGIYQILRNPSIYQRLSKELTTAFPMAEEGINYDQARKLEYLVSMYYSLILNLTWPDCGNQGNPEIQFAAAGKGSAHCSTDRLVFVW